MEAAHSDRGFHQFLDVVLLPDPSRVRLHDVGVVRDDLLSAYIAQRARPLQLLPAAKELPPGFEEHTAADHRVRPCYLEAGHVKDRYAAGRWRDQLLSALFFFD